MLNAIFLAITLWLMSTSQAFSMATQKKIKQKLRRSRSLTISALSTQPSATNSRRRSDSIAITTYTKKRRKQSKKKLIDSPNKRKNEELILSPKKSPRILEQLSTNKIKKMNLPDYARETIDFVALLHWVKEKYTGTDLHPIVDLNAYHFLEALKTLEPNISYFVYRFKPNEKVTISLYGLARTIYNAGKLNLKTDMPKNGTLEMISSYLNKEKEKKSKQYTKCLKVLIKKISSFENSNEKQSQKD